MVVGVLVMRLHRPDEYGWSEMAMVGGDSPRESHLVPTNRAERSVPAAPWSRGQVALTSAIFGLWCLVVLYAAVVADDPHEIVLDLIVLALGLLFGASAFGRSKKVTKPCHTISCSSSRV